MSRLSSLAVGLGALFMLVCLPCTALGFGMVIAPTRAGHVGTGWVVLIFSALVFALPSLGLFWVGHSMRTHARRLEHLGALGRASSRLPLNQLAEDMRIPRAKVRRLVLEAIAKGTLIGRLDIEHDVFISASTHEGVGRDQRRCAQCGGLSIVTVAPGYSAQCQYCGGWL